MASIQQLAFKKKQKVLFNFGKDPFQYALNEVFPDIHPLHLFLSKSQQSDLEKTFERYKNVGVSLGESTEHEDVIRGQGLMQYGQDLGITDDKDPMLLMICWKLNSSHKKCWELTKEEFIGGWGIIGSHNIDTMKKKMRYLER